MLKKALILILPAVVVVGFLIYRVYRVSTPTPFAPADALAFDVRRLPGNPIIVHDMDQSLIDEYKQYGYVNINGPSMIKVPEWVENPLGKYYLYFAHHKGDYIKLAYADRPEGPWRIYAAGAIHVKDSGFARVAPRADIKATIATLWKNWSQTEFWTLLRVGLAAREASKTLAAQGKTVSGESKPHIASPDAWIDDPGREIRLYFHGLTDGGIQASRVAVSRDGLHFKVLPQVLSAPYLRVFKHKGYYYGMAMPGLLYRGKNGLNGFEIRRKPVAGADMRHVALMPRGDRLFVFWSRVGDEPERILCSSMDIRSDDWDDWRMTAPVDVLRPEKSWEGGDLSLEPSIRTEITVPVRQLRDPAIFVGGEKTYLLYAVAGENGIAIAELKLDLNR